MDFKSFFLFFARKAQVKLRVTEELQIKIGIPNVVVLRENM